MNNFDVEADVNNAGLAIMSPFFPMLFYRLGYLKEDHRDFKDEDSRIRAIFIIQYLIYGRESEWSESELFLNKLLVVKTDNEGLPRSMKLTENEINIVDILLESIRHSWTKIAHVPIDTVRQTFFQRKAHYFYDERMKRGILKVELKPYDVLLESLQWNMNLIHYPWMERSYLIEVDWKLKS